MGILVKISIVLCLLVVGFPVIGDEVDKINAQMIQNLAEDLTVIQEVVSAKQITPVGRKFVSEKTVSGVKVGDEMQFLSSPKDESSLIKGRQLKLTFVNSYIVDLENGVVIDKHDYDHGPNDYWK